MENIIKTIGELSENIVKAFNDCELIIIVKKGEIKLVEKGELIRGVQRVEFTGALDEVPNLKIEKAVV